jgi:malate dehydrogenase
LGKGGVEKIYEIKLLPDEEAALRKSADAVQELVSVIQQRMPAGVRS